MKPSPFKYHDPRSKLEAVQLLGTSENAFVLAGGQSLMPMLNFRALAPDHVIDLNHVSELAGIRCNEGVLTIGAMTRQCDVEFSDSVSTTLPLLQAALAHVGHRQTRNRGTFGGSLCHLDPSAELVTASMALDATLVAESRGAVRRIPIGAWCKGYLTNALERGEMLGEIELRVWPPGHGYAFVEYARRRGDFAIVGIAALMALDRSGSIARAAVAVGGCAAGPQRLYRIESALLGRRPDPALFRDVVRFAAEIETMSDAYVSAEYRAHIAPVLTERALIQAAARALKGSAA